MTFSIVIMVGRGYFLPTHVHEASKILSKFILEFFLGADINIQRYIRQTHIGSIFMDYYIIAKRKGNPIFLSESFMTTYLSHMYFDSHSAIFYIFP